MIWPATKQKIVSKEDALPGSQEEMEVPQKHFVLGTPLKGPFSESIRLALFGMGCFWGAEKKFWEADGVYSTAVGYAGGHTPNPTYQEVCSGRTGHTEAVRVAWDSSVTSYEEMLRIFWETHDPTQGMRQGNDVGTQYRSAIYYYSDGQKEEAQISLERYQDRLQRAGYEKITTEIERVKEFYFAEPYHQQYLAKNPGGYCGLGGTGVTCR